VKITAFRAERGLEQPAGAMALIRGSGVPPDERPLSDKQAGGATD
jgi:hypothetical protein